MGLIGHVLAAFGQLFGQLFPNASRLPIHGKRIQRSFMAYKNRPASRPICESAEQRQLSRIGAPVLAHALQAAKSHPGVRANIDVPGLGSNIHPNHSYWRIEGR